jgi:hypothetical protein
MQARLTTKPLKEVISAIRALDLEPITLRVVDSELGKGWTREYADGIAAAYRTWLTMLAKHQDRLSEIALSKDVDEFWHAHILMTMKYAEDCEKVFGNFLHHNPHVGARTAADVANKAALVDQTRRLYQREFGTADRARAAWTGIAYCDAAAAAYCDAAAKSAAYCDAAAKSAAYCDAAVKQGAYCDAVVKSAAYCDAAAAYCDAVVTSEEAAYCDAASKSATYCDAAVKDAAYCDAAAKAAYCDAAAKPEDAVYCDAAAKEAAYCDVAVAAAYCDAAAKNAAYCDAAVKASAYCDAAAKAQPYCDAAVKPKEAAA